MCPTTDSGGDLELAIEARGLEKTYADPERGRVHALRGLDLAVAPGEIFGLLGPNGAGKTTTLRILSSLLAPTAGTARVAGVDVQQDPLGVRRRIGFLSASTGLYPRLTAREILRYFGELHGIPKERLSERIEELIASFGMHDFADGRCEGLSTGQRQKVSIARAVVHDPPVLILDEPTSGLDPLMEREFRRTVGEARDRGQTVFLSSHLLDEVEQAADRAAIIRAGTLVAIEDVAALRTRAVRRITLHLAHPVQGGVFDGVAGVRDADVRGRELHVTVEGSVDGLIKAAAQCECCSSSSPSDAAPPPSPKTRSAADWSCCSRCRCPAGGSRPSGTSRC